MTRASQPGLVTVPRLTSASAMGWVAGTAVTLLGAMGFIWATQAETRWTAAVVLPLVALAVLGLAGSGCTVDPTSHAISWRRFFVVRHTSAAAGLRTVEVVSNHGGTVLLALADGSRRRFVPLLALTDHMQRSQPAPVLHALADLVAQAPGAGAATARVLRRQAASVERGEAPQATPLAGRADSRLGRIAAAGGAAGGITSL